jgi:hypothetical protein
MNFTAGMHRLAILIGIVTTSATLVMLTGKMSADDFREKWWIAVLVSAVVGGIAWAFVMAIHWVIKGFKAK